MYIYVCIYTDMYIYIYTYACVSLYVHAYLYMYTKPHISNIHRDSGGAI